MSGMESGVEKEGQPFQRNEIARKDDVDNSEKKGKAEGILGMRIRLASNGFRQSMPACKGSAQVDELGIVPGEGEVGVEKEQTHEQPGQAEHGQKTGVVFVPGKIDGREGGLGRFCLLALLSAALSFHGRIRRPGLR